MDERFCPASMCPLFAPTGSPWTDEYDVACEREICGFYHNNVCEGRIGSQMQVDDAVLKIPVLQLGIVRAKHEKVKPTTFDCKFAHRCKWQAEAGIELCPPRSALAQGIDPRVCAY